jgi:tetratricopeptide (TPR) repeat protein
MEAIMVNSLLKRYGLSCLRPYLWALPLCMGIFLSGGALADQRDDRLNPLFNQLAAASSQEEAAQLANKIEKIWAEYRGENSDARSLLLLGDNLLNAGQIEAARSLYDQLTAADPHFAEGWNRLAITAFLMGDDMASINFIAKTLKLEPRHFGALAGLGRICLRQNAPVQALKAFEAALAINPQLSSIQEIATKLRREVYGVEL